MDILRKELNNIYASQHLECEYLDESVLNRCQEQIASLTSVNNACYVITDASADVCYIYAGSFALLFGFAENPQYYNKYNSSDEDMIYNSIHPEDLVEKRMLEYDFFRYVDSLDANEKIKYVATCRIRVRNCNDEYIYVNNTTQVFRPSPAGKIWLILCSYMLSPNQDAAADILPRIINNHTGDILALKFVERRNSVLSLREKEILHLIREGKSSKQIADLLKISIHTVNRHRQNILEKLSVGNSYEAIMAASAMKLL